MNFLQFLSILSNFTFIILWAILIIRNFMKIDRVYHQSAADIIIVLNALSFVSLGFILLIYLIRWKKITSFPLRLVFSMMILVILSMSGLLDPELICSHAKPYFSQSVSSGFCIFDAVLKVSSDLSSILWTALIIYSNFASIVLQKSLNQAQLSYIFIGFIFPVIVSLVPLFFKLYGFNTYSCWFDDPNRNLEFALKMSYYYIPLWLVFFVSTFMSIKVYKKLKYLGLDKKQLVFFKRLMLFPLVMLLTGFFSTINQVYNFVSNDYPEWLDDLAQIGESLYGLTNSFVYGFNPLIRQQILIVLKLKKVDEKDQTQLSQIGSRSSRRTQRLSELMS